MGARDAVRIYVCSTVVVLYTSSVQDPVPKFYKQKTGYRSYVGFLSFCTTVMFGASQFSYWTEDVMMH
jgi:hypothetical protein